MSPLPYLPVADDPLGRETDPPPQELTWDSTIRELFAASYNFSPDLFESAPRFIRMYGDRWQINWQLAENVDEPQNQTVVDISITVRPVAPAEITIKT